MGTTDGFGVDALPADATALSATEYICHDLTHSLDLGRRFDMVMCTEVVEHLDPTAAEALIGTIARHAHNLIIFSAAEPGQPGHGHINCRPLTYWLGLWRARGWLPVASETMGLRALASLSWFRRNLIVLRRHTAHVPDGTAVLEAIAARQFTWYDQSPGIRQTPFLEETPTGCGYAREHVPT